MSRKKSKARSSHLETSGRLERKKDERGTAYERPEKSMARRLPFKKNWGKPERESPHSFLAGAGGRYES